MMINTLVLLVRANAMTSKFVVSSDVKPPLVVNVKSVNSGHTQITAAAIIVKMYSAISTLACQRAIT
jgi:hypothetical protein